MLAAEGLEDMAVLGDIAVFEQFLSINFKLLNPATLLMFLALEQDLIGGVF